MQTRQIKIYICSFPLKLIGILVCLAWNTSLKYVTHYHHAMHALVSFRDFIVLAGLEPQVLFLDASGTLTHGLTPWCMWDLNPSSSFGVHDFVTCSCSRAIYASCTCFHTYVILIIIGFSYSFQHGMNSKFIIKLIIIYLNPHLLYLFLLGGLA
jgi:hypothetical protein